MVQRVTYRRRKSYNTRSNGILQKKTPGGRVTVQYRTKKANVPRCQETGKELYGIPALRPFHYKNLAKRKRTVSRAYGGVLCASAVRQRIVRAFIVEEARLVKALLKARTKKPVAEKKPVAKKAAPKAKKAAAPAKKTAQKKATQKK